VRLAGRNALVTGAASGIGRAVAEAFAAEGARVWLADIDEDGLTAAAAAIGGDAAAVVMDVAEQGEVDRVVAEIDDEAGGVDLLVNCAGEYALEPWLEIDVETWDRIFAVNARGMMLVVQAVARTMVARGRGGSIINIASAAGRRGDPNSVAYSASKAAAISITQSAALGLARHGIRVNAIAPGPVDTPMWSRVVQLRSGRGDQSAEGMAARVPVGRISDPAEQAQAALFLASEQSSYVTGQTLNVDGGLFPS
jgi:D-sorbitol dehydrogenase (acceptor)